MESLCGVREEVSTEDWVTREGAALLPEAVAVPEESVVPQAGCPVLGTLG